MQSKSTKQSSIIAICAFLVVGALAPMLDSTMTNIAINSITQSLHATVDNAQWVVTVYVLAMGIVVPIAGWAIDWISGKQLYLWALIGFLIGSIISGISTDITMLIIGRIIQGAGAGFIIPTISILVVRAAGGKNLGSLMSIIGLPMVLMPILGPTIGGFIIDQLNWHWIFYINIPIVIISLILLIIWLPKFAPTEHGKRLDIVSILLLTGIFTGLILGITKFSDTSKLWQGSVLWPVGIGLACLITYIVYAAIFPKRALVNLNLFKTRSFSAASILLLMSGITLNGAMFLLPLYFQNIRGLSVVWAGIYLIPQGIGMLLTRTQVGKITDQIGARWVVITGIIIATLSTLPFAFADASTNKWLLLGCLLIRGTGVGAFTVPIMSDSFTGMKPSQIPAATTATRMFQNIGSAFGTAILATVMTHQMTGQTATITNLSASYNTAFVWSIAITLIALVPAWFLSVKHH
ncbi:major facilitator superfamily transporter [Paucilactobacillus hokkaidonensis JCM 18461]|uniref:Major facilitator superfamily transporter n=2 Tax=Paucilactobacillus hokkaidonensis TaxID=1193095 RepID=A0A0A1GVK2_9LACO|nr:MDR family MFS transporter [Paucilactobacillus hokkaidonensis]KRO10260.1 major facilitator superfamily permease [Paucilactobacillus hokkaidonensis]BAP86277.1 major facilitator superfamily transporter [Paucilactobacillus hokkaidonensis JCM 18461]